MYNTFAEIPWWVCAGLIFVGLALIWMSRGRTDRRLAGIAAFVLAIALAAISWMLESDREQVIRNTRQLVEAVQKRDRPGMLRRFHPCLGVYGVTDPAALAESAVFAADTFGLESVSIVSLHAAADEDLMLATMQVRATGTGVLLTNWRLTWTKDRAGMPGNAANAWRMLKAELLESPGINSQQVEQALRKR